MTLRIQKSDDREVVAFALTGRIEKEHTVEMQRLIDGETDRTSRRRVEKIERGRDDQN